jgi:hypothetical protein
MLLFFALLEIFKMFGGFTNRNNFGNQSFPQRIIGQFGNVLDSNAAAFIAAANITDNTIQQAINYLVVDLKNNNLWNKIRVLYPLVGGNSTTTSFNLVNPSFNRITWVNAPTFSSTGVLGNGLNQYGETNANVFNILGANNCSLSYYTRTTGSGPIGAFGSGANFALYPQLSGTVNISSTSTTFAGALTNTGLFFATKTLAGNIRAFKDGIFRSQSVVSTTALPTISFHLLRTNGFVGYNNQECAFCHLGENFTDNEALIFNNIVQQFQTALSRQV